MTRDLLAEVGRCLYGPRWQSDLARDLAGDRDPRSMLRNIQRYDAGQQPVPTWLWPELRTLMAARGKALAQMRRKIPK